jgi:glycosyltransferase involved in cell wall biosynthesis
LFLTKYTRQGASSRIRTLQYLPFLAEHGVTVKVNSLLREEYLAEVYSGRHRSIGRVAKDLAQRVVTLLGASRFDLVWLEKEAVPWAPAWLDDALLRRVPFVLDFDDAIFHRYDDHHSPIVRRALKGKIDRLMHRAAAVVVGNEYLADRARSAGARRVELIPSVVDLEHYPVVDAPPAPHPFTIGWIGTPKTAQYLHLISGALADAASNGARIVLVGSGKVDLGVPCEIVDWTESDEAAQIRRFDVGIMPLADRPWERGKCGYKLIQYLACARPVVASPVGANLKIVEEGLNGFLALAQEDWVRAFRSLQSSPETRQRLGAHGRRRVEAEFSLQAAAPRLLGLLREVAASRRRFD